MHSIALTFENLHDTAVSAHRDRESSNKVQLE